jgi:hypothetical protein
MHVVLCPFTWHVLAASGTWPSKTRLKLAGYTAGVPGWERIISPHGRSLAAFPPSTTSATTTFAADGPSWLCRDRLAQSVCDYPLVDVQADVVNRQQAVSSAPYPHQSLQLYYLMTSAVCISSSERARPSGVVTVRRWTGSSLYVVLASLTFSKWHAFGFSVNVVGYLRASEQIRQGYPCKDRSTKF